MLPKKNSKISEKRVQFITFILQQSNIDIIY